MRDPQRLFVIHTRSSRVCIYIGPVLHFHQNARNLVHFQHITAVKLNTAMKREKGKEVALIAVVLLCVDAGAGHEGVTWALKAHVLDPFEKKEPFEKKILVASPKNIK